MTSGCLNLEKIQEQKKKGIFSGIYIWELNYFYEEKCKWDQLSVRWSMMNLVHEPKGRGNRLIGF